MTGRDERLSWEASAKEVSFKVFISHLSNLVLVFPMMLQGMQ